MKRRHSKHQVNRGFTLVELLVVISILALLIAILLPSLSKARKQAKGLVCAANLHSHGQALQMYAGEYEDDIPTDVALRVDPVTQKVWELPFAVPLLWMLGQPIDTEDDYVAQFRDIPLIQCPSFPKDNYNIVGKRLDEQTLDYVVNGFPKRYVPDPAVDTLLPNPDQRLTWNGGQSPDDKPQKLSDIKNTSGIIFVTETHRSMVTGPNLSWRADQSGPWPFPLHDVWRGAHLPRGIEPRIANDLRHPAGINMVFYDGHVETRRPESLVETDFYFPQ